MSPVHDPRYSRTRTKEMISDDVTRQEYLKPLTLILLGGVVMVIYFIAQGGVAFAAVGGAFYLLGVAIQIVIGLVALLTATSILSSGAGPLGLAVLRLAGCFIFTSATGLLFGMMGCIGLILNLIVLGMLIAWLFDFEGVEAAVVVLILVAIQIAVMFVLYRYIAE